VRLCGHPAQWRPAPAILSEADIVNVAPLLFGSSSTQPSPAAFPFPGSALSGLGSIAYVGTA
jgi:hypothetical protein